MKRSSSSLRAASRAAIHPIVLLIALLLSACGDESIVDLDDRVHLELFTEIEETPEGPRSYVQRATVVIAPSVPESDVDEITRVRIVDQFDQDWVLSEDPEFVAGERGWELVAERSTNRDVRTGPWNLRMVVEEQGVFVMGHAQRFPAVGPPTISEASVAAEGVVTVRWSVPSPSHDWTLRVVQRSPTGETVLGSQNGQAARSGGVITARFDVPTSSFEEPNELLYRLVLENNASRRTVEDVLTPSGP